MLVDRTVCDEAAEVPADNAMPRRAFPLVKLLYISLRPCGIGVIDVILPCA